MNFEKSLTNFHRWESPAMPEAKHLFNFSLSIFLLFVLPSVSFSEGTKQIVPFYAAGGKLCIDKSRNNFGWYNASPEFRINIYISDLTENFCFGLGKITKFDSLVEVRYQVKNPAGNIVFGPALVPKSGQGFITSYEEAVAGPIPASGGYNPIRHTPLTPGNYSLEFYYPPDSGTVYSYLSYLTFDFFDITVLSAAGQAIPGRVWSKAWQFNCGPVQPPPTASRFYGTMFILSEDSIVTSVNCNGFVGGTFSISSNQTGCSTTGNIEIDRQSRPGFHTYPQYKVFLSDPDSTIFPTGTAKPGISLPVTINNNCIDGSVDLGIKVTQDGLIEVLVEVDPNPGADPADVKITANVLANPGGNGFNIIHWNGTDGLGKQVPDSKPITATIRFIHGITHLPIYDIEYNDNGYQVAVVRPPGPKPDIYWDDSLLSDLGTINLNGCNGIQGCHFWDISIGDTNTINSWWYVSSTTTSSISFFVKRLPGSPGNIIGDPSFCERGLVRTYSIMREPSSNSYIWSYSGTGAGIVNSDTSATLSFSASATSGTLSVSGYNQNCGAGQAATLPINFYPPPQVFITSIDSVCYNEPAILLTTGSPVGGIYSIDGIVQTSFAPSSLSQGNHLITYQYTDEHGCQNADSSTIFVKISPDCEILIWVPSAFTPDGDVLNDYFRPVTRNVKEFSMNIYNRSGELMFTSSNPEIGWDGSYRGNPCPEGSYVYYIVYQSSLAPPKNTTLSGNIMLVR
ncbi:MAG: gliding motility-associated C-terminal domain-containing protein [Bacteroidetes bacterium]|nr:gliding motility-associated C-terminal domain-containing protein [Bacteroidota bacterium]